MTKTFAWLAAAVLLAAAAESQTRPAGKVRVLLDSDTYNEMDDQFFLAYALMEPRFEIEGVCATQYRVTEGSVDESYYEARRILDLMGRSNEVPLFMGSDMALPDPGTQRASPASRFIIQRALAEDTRPLYILAVGALTNVASAYLEEPAIKNRIRVIWLGGSRWPEGALSEFNAANDRPAVKCILEAGMDLTQIPTETCARQLTTTFREAENRLRRRGPVAEYLVDLYRDYGHDHKVIWDMTAVACLLQLAFGEKFFDIEEVRAPVVEEKTLRYLPNREGAPMRVCKDLDRDKIFDDFFRRLPAPLDLDPPYLTLAASRGNPRSLTLTFNEDLSPLQAQDISNYRLEPEVPVSRAVLADPRTVRLTLGSDLASSETYTVTCLGLADDSPRKNRIQSRNSFRFMPEPAMRDGLRARLRPGPAGERFTEEVLPEPALDLWFTTTRPGAIMRRAALKTGSEIVLEGFLEAPVKHDYEISCFTEDTVSVELGGKQILSAGRNEGTTRAMARVRLEKGKHPVRIIFRPRGAGYLLNLYWSFPFHEKQRIPWNYLLHSGS